MPAWVALSAAIAFEIAGTTFMKMSDGFARLWPSIGLFVCYALSFVGLTLALKRIDVGVAYAIWSGVGTAAIAAIGMVMFGEPFSVARVLWIGVIIVGVVGLQMTSV